MNISTHTKQNPLFFPRSARFIALGLLALTAFLVYSKAEAATMTLKPADTVVGLATPFSVSVLMDSDVPVNAIQGSIDVPDSMEVIGMSDGNSVINMWIERPHVNSARQVSFSGIIPGGFSGRQGTIMTMTVQAKSEGTFRFSLNPISRMYKNDVSTSPEPISSPPVDITVSKDRQNPPVDIVDTMAPEPFTPALVSLPDGETGEKWAVTFETQDKISGMSSYSVAESTSRINISNVSRLNSLSWFKASSPHILADQQLSSYIYVKAIDAKGNERAAVLPPRNPPPWSVSGFGYMVLAIAVIIIGYIFKRRIFNKRP